MDRSFQHITECGIPGIGNIPFGLHLCHFFPERQDLVDSLVPYLMAGLRKNERCLWITAPPLPADESWRSFRIIKSRWTGKTAIGKFFGKPGYPSLVTDEVMC